MKVLHVTPAFWPAFVYGGPIRSVHGLCRHLARLGAEVRVLTTDANGRDETLKVETGRPVTMEPRLQVRYCRRRALHSVSAGLVCRLAGAIRWADVVHLTGVYSFPTLPTLALCRWLDRPVVWSPRGSLQAWRGRRRPARKRAWVAACRGLLPEHALLHVTSQEEADESAAALPRTGVVLVPNGIDAMPEAAARSPNGIPPRRILFLGRLHPVKAVDNLLRACSELGPGWRLDIAGDGDPAYVASLRSLAEELGLGGSRGGAGSCGNGARVRWLGRVPDAEKGKLLAGATLVVLPSHRENFGMVVVEALAAGTPVIAGRGTPWRNLVERRCGLWVDNDPKSLAAALRKTDFLPLEEMGERGRRWVEREYAWPALARRMLDAYTELAHAA